MDSSVLICTVLGWWFSRCTRCAWKSRSMSGMVMTLMTSGSVQSWRTVPRAVGVMGFPIVGTAGMFAGGAIDVNARAAAKYTLGQFLITHAAGARRALRP